MRRLVFTHQGFVAHPSDGSRFDREWWSIAKMTTAVAAAVLAGILLALAT